MHILLEFLKPTDCSFHGIVPGSANYPLGRIALNVCFGNHCNFRREKLEFEVMDWPSQYHAILRRPAFSHSMAVPHYTYLLLKIPGPSGIITVKGSFELCAMCNKNFTRWHNCLAQQPNMEDQRKGHSATHHPLQVDLRQIKLSTIRSMQRKFGSIQRT
jgi:hypothetical protein